MRRKVRLILEAINRREPFWHLDCDLRFYGKLPDMFDADMAFQRDHEGACAGMFWCRANSWTRDVWEEVADLVERGKYPNDQIALWHALRENPQCRTIFLPSTYWTHGAAAGTLYPCHLSADSVPLGLVAHHANYAVGVLAKMCLGDEVESLVNYRRARA
jgi:hypothetical protein